MQTQTLILTDIEKRGKEFGYIVTSDNTNAMNRGIMTFRAKNYDTILSMHFSFDSANFTLSFQEGNFESGQEPLARLSSYSKEATTSSLLFDVSYWLRQYDHKIKEVA